MATTRPEIDAGSATPLYAQVEAVVASEIAGGTLPAGSQLPTENELIERFGVSRPTVRRAVQNLVSRGLVEIQRGKGTYVTRPKITQELTTLSGFVEDMQAQGRRATARLLGKRLVAANKTVAHQLAVPAGSLVMRIRRVRLADGEPVSFDETYLPRKVGEKVITNDLEVEPIFSLLETKYDMPLVEAEYRLEAVAADPVVAEALGVEKGSPLFRIERTSYCAGSQPVDYEQLYYRGNMVRFVTRLARRAKERK
jgi:GntR family transcriptional regulator